MGGDATVSNYFTLVSDLLLEAMDIVSIVWSAVSLGECSSMDGDTMNVSYAF